MTRLLSQGQADLLRLLARMPFLDRLEMAALAGRSRGGVYQAAARLEEAGLAAAVPHGTPLLAPTRRYYLTEKGLNGLAVDEVQPVGWLLREYPLSLRWRRILLERLDAAAVIYRLASALSGLGHPVGFRWRRALPQDADMSLPDGRVLAILRPGGHRRARRFRQAPLAAGPGSPARGHPGHRPRRGAAAPGRRPATRGPHWGVPRTGLLRVGAARRGGRSQRSNLALLGG